MPILKIFIAPCYAALPATPGHWVPETFRQYVVATRPWSISASAIPVILAGALAYRYCSGLKAFALDEHTAPL